MESIHLINFECFVDLTFPLRPLTLLSGLNDTGKTALLRSLLLLQQSRDQGTFPRPGLRLNGPLTNIGTVGDLLHRQAPEESTMSIGIRSLGCNFEWRFQTWNNQLDMFPVVSPHPGSGLSLLPKVYYLSSCVTGGRIDFRLLETASANSLILIEHPEFGLHGSAVTTVANRIATAVARGVQVMVESHSDHLLNGLRLAIHQGRLKPEAFNCLHFDFAKGDQRLVVVKEIVFDRRGRSRTWPEHFFDEWEKALEQLLDPIKPN